MYIYTIYTIYEYHWIYIGHKCHKSGSKTRCPCHRCIQNQGTRPDATSAGCGGWHRKIAATKWKTQMEFGDIQNLFIDIKIDIPICNWLQRRTTRSPKTEKSPGWALKEVGASGQTLPIKGKGAPHKHHILAGAESSGCTPGTQSSTSWVKNVP